MRREASPISPAPISVMPAYETDGTGPAAMAQARILACIVSRCCCCCGVRAGAVIGDVSAGEVGSIGEPSAGEVGSLEEAMLGEQRIAEAQAAKCTVAESLEL